MYSMSQKKMARQRPIRRKLGNAILLSGGSKRRTNPGAQQPRAQAATTGAQQPGGLGPRIHRRLMNGCLEELPGLVLLVLIEFLDDHRRFRLRRRLSGGHHCIDDDAGSVITIRGSISYRIYVQLCISGHSREGRVTFPEKAAERTAKSFFVVNAEETLRY